MMIESVEFRQASGIQADIHSSNSAVLIVPNAPANLELGIDCMSYETGPKFVGISLIPAGLHFIHFGIGMGSKQGFFFVAKKGDLIVRPWNSADEEISSTNTLSEESMHQLQLSLHRGVLNASIGPYPLSQMHIWKNLTAFISEKVLQRSNCDLNTPILPSEYDLHQSASSNPDTLGTYFVDIAAAEDVLIQSMDSDSYHRIGITRLGVDKSPLVDYLVENDYDHNIYNLLGELQLSFVVFMLLFSYPGLNQWKKLIDTICRSERLLLSNVDFTIAFLRIFYEQLNFSPSDFFNTELSKDNFLCPAVSSLFSVLSAEDVPVELKEHRKRLFIFMQKKFGLFGDSSMLGSVDISSLPNSPFIDKFNLVAEDMPVFVDSSDLRGYSFDAEAKEMSSDDLVTRTPLRSLELSEVAPCLSSVVEDSDSSSSSLSVLQRWGEIDAALSQAQEGSRGLIARSSQQGSGTTAITSLHSIEVSDCDCVVDSVAGDKLHDVRVMESAAAAGGPAAGDDESVLGSAMPPPLLPPMSHVEKEAAMFSWRYPLLFDAMQATQGREDMVMTAMRLLEEAELRNGDGDAACELKVVDNSSYGCGTRDKMTSLQMEALRFVGDEVSLMGFTEE